MDDRSGLPGFAALDDGELEAIIHKKGGQCKQVHKDMRWDDSPQVSIRAGNPRPDQPQSIGAAHKREKPILIYYAPCKPYGNVPGAKQEQGKQESGARHLRFPNPGYRFNIRYFTRCGVQSFPNFSCMNIMDYQSGKADHPLDVFFLSSWDTSCETK